MEQTTKYHLQYYPETYGNVYLSFPNSVYLSFPNSVYLSYLSFVSRSQTLFGNAFNDAPRHIRDKPNMMTSEKLKYNAERCEKNQFQETTDLTQVSKTCHI